MIRFSNTYIIINNSGSGGSSTPVVVASWLYQILLSQTDTDDPVAVVLNDKITGITWGRNDVGTYYATKTGGFPALECTPQDDIWEDGDGHTFRLVWTDENTYTLYTYDGPYDPEDPTANLADGLLNNRYVCIERFNLNQSPSDDIITNPRRLTTTLVEGDNVLPGISFTEKITALPFMVSVLDSTNQPVDIAWSSTQNGSYYDINITMPIELTNVKVFVLC